MGLEEEGRGGVGERRSLNSPAAPGRARTSRPAAASRVARRWCRCLGDPERLAWEHDRGQAAGRQPRRRGAAGRGRRLRPHDQPAQPGLLLRRLAALRPRCRRRGLPVRRALGARLARLRLFRLLLHLLRVLLRGRGVPSERRRPRRAPARYPPAGPRAPLPGVPTPGRMGQDSPEEGAPRRQAAPAASVAAGQTRSSHE